MQNYHPNNCSCRQTPEYGRYSSTQYVSRRRQLHAVTEKTVWTACHLRWLTFHGRPGSVFTMPKKDFAGERSLKNSTNHFMGWEVVIDDKQCTLPQDLLCLINRVSFAVDDVRLFLDTHPCDANALAYFHEYSKLRNQALKEYAKYYGPLTVDTTMTSCTDRWNWINEPWPWQEGGC